MFLYSSQVEHCLTAFIYQHSYLSKTQIHMQAVLSSQFPCSCCVAVSISASAVQMVLLLTCLLQPYHGQLMPQGCILCMSCAMSFLCGQPFMIYVFSFCRCTSLVVTSCISHIDLHTGRPTDVSIMLMFMLRSHISLSLFPSWLCHDSQSAMNNSGHGLSSMHTLY